MKKKILISVTAILTVVVFFAIFLSIWFLGDTYPDFKSARAEFKIPGLDEGAIPQGISSCYANYTVETTEEVPSVDEQGNEIVEEVVKKVTKMQPYFFISAYMKDNSPSRIYVVGQDTGYIGYVTMADENGQPFMGHCGGIAINNITNEAGTVVTSANMARYCTLWVTCDRTVYVAKSSDDYAASNKTIAQEIVEKAARIKLPTADENAEYDFSVKFTASFNANCEASFCYYYNNPNNSDTSGSGISYDRLYIGEFYHGKNYETDDSHKLTTPNGYKNTAFMYEYEVHYNGKYGLTTISNSSTETDRVPDDMLVPKIRYIYSLPERIQGVAWAGRDSYGSNNGTLILSQSYGLTNSHLLCFDYSKVMSSSNRKYYNAVNGSNFVYEGVKRASGTNYTDPTLYIFYVDKGNADMFIDDLSIPSMSEGICSVTRPMNAVTQTRVYVLFESASKKYRLFVRNRTDSVYSLRFNT